MEEKLTPVEDVECNGIFCCNRHWCIATPDFAAPGLCFSVIHLALFLGIGILLITGDLDCGATDLTIYLAAAVILQIVEFFLSLAVFVAAGFLARWGIRSVLVPLLVQIRLLLILADLGLGIFGIYALLEDARNESCGEKPAREAAVTLVFLAFFFSIFQICCVRFTYNSQGRECANVSDAGLRHLCAEAFCFCIWKSWTKEDLDGDVLDMILEDIRLVFGGFEGFTSSDVVRALKLVRDQQRRRAEKGHRFDLADIGGDEEKGEIGSTQSHVDQCIKEFSQPELRDEDTKRIREAKHYFKYASAACGWPIYVAHKGPCRAMCALGCKVSRCCQGMNAEQEGNIVYRSCACRLSLPAFIDYAEIEPTDILMANMSIDIDRVVYYVCMERATNTMIIAIRGSMSAQDLITDGRQAYVKFPLNKNTFGSELVESRCGTGFKNVCMRILKDMAETKLVVETLKGTNCSVLVTGHSLGGAISTLLPVFMDNHPLFMEKKIRGFAFAPPPTLPKNLACHPRVRSMVTSFVYQDDVVPRLSVHNLSLLRLQVVHELRKAKGVSVRRLMNHGVPGGSDQDDEIDEKSLLRLDARNSDPLYIPGTIFHMKTKVLTCSEVCTGCYQFICCCCRGMVAPVGTYKTICYKAKADTFQELIVAPQMTHEHLPSSYERAFQDLKV
eukprot:CAMPEP_0184498794 /NCGR_PEP_ID=MMETSP0113_2-20130426/39863_1 /TAXON_ID=91329 /ORGANISM="Norrisiella sphaerica, Strain BC52" /LENGTH=671 /DNA_ID=CAMNT_0026886451 /DNA_START=132 /DNA_END=2147 /DNA_ORIENTATION=-